MRLRDDATFRVFAGVKHPRVEQAQRTGLLTEFPDCIIHWINLLLDAIFPCPLREIRIAIMTWPQFSKMRSHNSPSLLEQVCNLGEFKLPQTIQCLSNVSLVIVTAEMPRQVVHVHTHTEWINPCHGPQALRHRIETVVITIRVVEQLIR